MIEVEQDQPRPRLTKLIVKNFNKFFRRFCRLNLVYEGFVKFKKLAIKKITAAFPINCFGDTGLFSFYCIYQPVERQRFCII